MTTIQLDFNVTDDLAALFRQELPAGYTMQRVDDHTISVFNGQQSAPEHVIIDSLRQLIRIGRATCTESNTCYDLSDGEMVYRDIEVFNLDGTSQII